MKAKTTLALERAMAREKAASARAADASRRLSAIKQEIAAATELGLPTRLSEAKASKPRLETEKAAADAAWKAAKASLKRAEHAEETAAEKRSRRRCSNCDGDGEYTYESGDPGSMSGTDTVHAYCWCRAGRALRARRSIPDAR